MSERWNPRSAPLARPGPVGPAGNLQYNATVAGNTITEFNAQRQQTQVRLPGYTAGNNDNAAVQTYLINRMATAAVVAVAGSDDETAPPPPVRPNAVAVIDADGSVSGQVALDGTPGPMAAGDGAVWVADTERGVVARLDTATRTIRQTIDVGHGPAALAVEPRGVWVANRDDGTVSVISPQTNAVVETIPVGRSVDGLCIGDGSVWVASPLDYAVARIDMETGRRTGTVRLDDQPARLACHDGAVWVSSPAAGTVTEIRDVPVRTVALERGVSELAAGAGGLWATNPTDGTVSRIDTDRGAVAATVALGGPGQLAVTDDAVWVSSASGVTRIAAADATVTEELQIGPRPQGLAIVDGAVWLGVADAGARHRGGTLRLEYALAMGWRDLDPATGDSGETAEILTMMLDGLIRFRRTGGFGALALVPNLAETVPAPSDGGRTYTFRLRPGLRYSTGEPVRASDVRFSLERALRQPGAAPGLLSAVTGTTDCTPQRCDLSRGVVTDDTARTVTFRLQQPDGDFLYKLAPLAVLPPSVGTATPAKRPLPTTGPYRIAEFTPRRLLRLERNPRFEAWSANRPDGYADEIVVRLGVDGEAAVARVLAGKADRINAFGTLPPAELPRLRRRAPGQLRASVLPSTFYFVLNTKVAPFDELAARRAVAFAFDRRAAVAAVGGSDTAQPTCQILPPSFPGHRPYCPYTVPGSGGARGRPDLARARRLVRRSGTAGTRVTVQVPNLTTPDLGQLMTRTLRGIGYDASLRVLDVDPHFASLGDTRERTQIGLLPWTSAYPAPSDFLQNFSCDALQRGSPFNLNASQFCDPEVDRLMTEATRLQAIDPDAADRLWARAERAIVDRAPAVPAYNLVNTDLVSERLGNYQFSPVEGLLADQAWVR